MLLASAPLACAPSGSVRAEPPDPVTEAQRMEAEGLLDRCTRMRVDDLVLTFSPGQDSITVPGVLIRFVTLSTLLGLDHPRKWQAALKGGWVPGKLADWLGIGSLEELAGAVRVGWIAPRRLVEVLSERVGVILIEMGQPRPGAVVRQTIRRLLVPKGCVRDGGLVMRGGYWKRLLRQTSKGLRPAIAKEVRERILWAFGQLELSQLAPRRWRPMPSLSAEERQILEAAQVEGQPERLAALSEALDGGLFDFVADLLATSYSVHGRRAYPPLLMWKVVMAMLATERMHPGRFLASVNDSVSVRLFLEVMSTEQLPSARRIKGFLTERLSPVIEHLVLWFNVGLVEKGGLTISDELGTDGMNMTAQARTRYDAAGVHLKPHLHWLMAQLRSFVQARGREDLTETEREGLLAAFAGLDWTSLGSAREGKWAILKAIRNALGEQVVTPAQGAHPTGSRPPPAPFSGAFVVFAATLAVAFGERLNAFGPRFDWNTVYDPQCSARTKHGKTVHGYGLQLVVDLAYGLVWAFAAFPSGTKFQPRIAEFMLSFKARFGLGSIKLTSDREFTIAEAIARWHQAEIFSYGPRTRSPAANKGIFTEPDFEIHADHAVCPNGKVLKRKPKMVVRGSSKEWRYQALRSDCHACPLRAQCTKAKHQRTLAVNVYREDVARHQARMEADPEVTRDLMARHKALVEGAVNNLKNHQGAKHALWKGLAMARLQFGLAILMLNVLKWHKIRHGMLASLSLSPNRLDKAA
jgi:hypothetical protein